MAGSSKSKNGRRKKRVTREIESTEEPTVGSNLSHNGIELLAPEVMPPRSYFVPKLPVKRYAEIALFLINGKENVVYQLVEPLYSFRSTLLYEKYVNWCHVGFAAKLKNVDDSLVHFFAELLDPQEKKFSLNAYAKMDPSGAGTLKGCGICPSSAKYPHPINGEYTAGWAGFGSIPLSDDEWEI